MSKLLIENIISEVNLRLNKKYPDFKGTYFYGSRAVGKSTKESDYDIVFLFERNKIDRSLKDEIIGIVYDYELEHEIIIDSKIYTFDSIENPATPYRINVKAEGVFYGI